MIICFFRSPTEDVDEEAASGWYIAPSDEIARPALSGRSRMQQWVYHNRPLVRYVLLPLVVLLLVGIELRTSIGQALLLSQWASTMTHAVEEGRSSRIRFPEHGPYNERLGYTRLSSMVDALDDTGFEVAAQSRMSWPFAASMDLGLYPVYDVKDQAGLSIVDRRGQDLFRARYPSRAYTSPDSIPRLVRESLLYIENRDLLDDSYRYKNPAVEWDRFAGAVLERLVTGGEGPGGSTLATQLTKVRHSPGGLTTSSVEKLRQMASASLQAYRNGPVTADYRRAVVKEYLNQLPLAAAPGHGEVNGLGDGLWAWYGADFDSVNQALARVPEGRPMTPEERTQQAVAFRQVLSLLLSTRSPSRYLVRKDGPDALNQLTDRYLPLLARAGVITDTLRDAALNTSLTVQRRAPNGPPASFVTRKAANSVRVDLLRRLGLTNLPALDRLDLTVRTTFDGAVQEKVAEVLERLNDPAYVREQGLVGERLLAPENAPDVNYSVVLYERQPDANVLRVQADNVEGPFDVNEGSKLELGSTAKVRVLITYLQLVERAYQEFVVQSPEALETVSVDEDDEITKWVLEYLSEHPAAEHKEILSAAMNRTYSGSPTERFFTGGGVHVFRNFNAETNRPLSVRAAVEQSANLAFIRIMRDVVNFHIARLPGRRGSVLDDPSDSRREAYLRRFANQEGSAFLNRYLRMYKAEAPHGNVLAALGNRHQLPARRLAWAYRSVFPEAGREPFKQYLQAYATDGDQLSSSHLEELYEKTTPTGHSWHDRGYLAGIHPLELWLVSYLHTYPGASSSQVLAASTDLRQEVYQWLFRKRKRTQDPRIQTMLEQEAFQKIHELWVQLGYPFDQLVPTLATALGSSADRPASLAELMGILLRDGKRYPTVRIDSMRFAADTPYETALGRRAASPERVLSPEVCNVVREVLQSVVERGTAVRARGAVQGVDGTALAIGGKTGTGDNQIRTTGPGGIRRSVAVSRTSTFVFFAGDRFFGTVVAYVDGPKAEDFRFTSSLPASVFRILGPTFTPLLTEDEGSENVAER